MIGTLHLVALMAICTIAVLFMGHNYFMTTTEEQQRKHQSNLLWLGFAAVVILLAGLGK